MNIEKRLTGLEQRDTGDFASGHLITLGDDEDYGRAITRYCRSIGKLQSELYNTRCAGPVVIIEEYIKPSAITSEVIADEARRKEEYEAVPEPKKPQKQQKRIGRSGTIGGGFYPPTNSKGPPITFD